VGEVTEDRILRERLRIVRVLAMTAPGSDVPEAEQNRLLAECCAESCRLLEDWLASSWWDGLRPSGDGTVADHVPDEEITAYLNGKMATVLERAGADGPAVSESAVEDARAAMAAAAQRHRRMRQDHLYRIAGQRIRKLTREVCTLAGHLRDTAAQAGAAAAQAEATRAQAAARRKRARATLDKVGAVLLPIALFMASTGPQQASHTLSEWGHEAVHAFVVYDLAVHAEPELGIAPPGPGSALGPG
jgi:hypothetical protein